MKYVPSMHISISHVLIFTKREYVYEICIYQAHVIWYLMYTLMIAMHTESQYDHL